MSILKQYLLQPAMVFAENGFATTKDVFTPNKVISKAKMSTVVMVQLTLLFTLWFMYGSELLPNPYEIGVSMWKLLQAGTVIGELLTTLTLIIQSMAITVVVSFAISYLTIIPFFRPLGFVVSKLRFLTLVGLQFAFTIWNHGDLYNLKISLFVFSVSVFFIDSMITIINSIEKERFIHARTIRLSEWRTAWEVIILGTFPKILDAMRSNFAMAWMMLTMIEVISKSDGGIGVIMADQNKYLHLDAVFAMQLMILILAMGQDALFGLLKKKTCGWAFNNIEKR
ncbi:MAG: nitrate ABC transporter permease [Candidatus Absconditabacteria bacterium]